MLSVQKTLGPSIMGSQLRAAREGIGLSLEEVAEAAQVSSRELAEWESDEVEPPIERVWELAELYCRGVDYFLRRTPAPPPHASFRVARARAKPDLSLEARQVLARFEELCRAQTQLEELLQEPPPPALPTVAQPADAEALAESERIRLDLGDKPIKNLRTVLETQGVRVFELPVPEDEFAGFSWRHPGYGPCILVNAGDVVGRRRWTLAHEYFHLVASDTPHICDLESLSSSEERLAERFAANFLMPPEAFVSDWQERAAPGEGLKWGDIAPVASRYRVSLEAAAIRLSELGAVPREEIDRLLRVKAEPQPSYGRPRPRFERQLGERYVALALDAYSRGRISLGKLAECLGISAQRALEAAEAWEANGGA